MRLVRWEVRLLRPVPLRPLTVTAGVVRDGRRVQVVEAALHHDGAEVCRAIGMRIRVTEDLELPAGDGTLPPPPGPEEARATDHAARDGSFIETAVEMRFLHGSMKPSGPATVWTRLLVTVVEGEEPSPLTRLAAVADFGNGISALVPWRDWLFINPELTVYAQRPPRGEWICLDARSELSPAGTGVAHSVLSDRDGSIGHALQVLLVDRR
jgi:Thioesterase-like superfamily